MDTLTPEQRSERMGRVRQKNTKPELRVRRLIHSMGFRYRLHSRSLPGHPDLVFASRRKVVFVHGCFWHRHDGCPLCRWPKTRLDFWKPKLEDNSQRDKHNLKVVGFGAAPQLSHRYQPMETSSDHKCPTLFAVGELYSSSEIQAALAVGNAGGVRVSLSQPGVVRRVVVMTSVPSARQASENPYHDRIEGDVLIYTGAGREGDQLLSGANRRLVEQVVQEFPVYGFLLVGSRRSKTIGTKRWRFLGLLEYLRHYPEYQVDVRQETRQVWLFEFRIHPEVTPVPIEHDREISARVFREAVALDLLSEEDRQLVPDEQPLVEPFRFAEVEAIRRKLLGVGPRDFEHLIGAMLTDAGFQRVEVTRYSQDGGIDVTAVVGDALWPLRGSRLQVQAKRWMHTVGRKEVAELRGSLLPFAHGAVVTTSHFSKAAIIEAAEPGKNPIVLMDGYGLADQVRQIPDLGP